MTGLVLCGGNSSRMGSDKGLLLEEGTAWAGLAAEKLKSLGLPVVLSVNGQQALTYRQIFPTIPLIADHPDLQVKGPLAGLLSIHAEFPQEDIFILACDMPRMNTSVLQLLYDHYFSRQLPEAIVFMNGAEPEPLCAIYSALALEKVSALYQQQRLARHSMKFMLEQLEVSRLPIPQNQLSCFSNVNSPGDLPR